MIDRRVGFLQKIFVSKPIEYHFVTYPFGFQGNTPAPGL
ncbi:hypothetical protein FHR70_001875 [Microvirga lupini]|uniref:Uncharacterized protein n=1 Tax=Microvirga lupini TaxID=420324 RepID=A0A7W4VKJ2_9HYPH|nr:hypothetical protein [Microvirga lupini]